MRKFLLFFVLLFSFVVGLNSAGATWIINGGTTYIGGGIVSECTLNPVYQTHTAFDDITMYIANVGPLTFDSAGMDEMCGANAVVSTGSGSFIVASLDTLSTGTMDKVPTAFEGDFGDFVVDLLMLGLIIISIIVFKKVTNKSKG